MPPATSGGVDMAEEDEDDAEEEEEVVEKGAGRAIAAHS